MDFTSTPSAPPQTMTWRNTAAVETCRVGSASLSASYYALLGLAVPPVVVYGTPVYAAAIGLGALAAALDYVKGAMLSAGLGGRGLGVLRRGTALILGAVLAAASIIAVDGVLLKLRATTAAEPAHAINAHGDTRAELLRVSGELAALVDVRSTDQVRADMDRTRIGPKTWRYTRECTDFTDNLAAYRKACEPILNLRVEMADAIRKGGLEIQRAELQSTLDELGPPPTAADPQATHIANVTGYSESAVLLALAAVLGIAVELVSCFGRFALDRPARTDAGSNRSRRTDVDATLAERSVAGQLLRNHPALLKNAPSNGSGPDGGAALIALPVAPKRPGPSNGSAAPSPETANGSDTQRADERAARKADVLAFVREEAALGNVVESQRYLAETLGMATSSLSELLGELEAEGLIERRDEGRRKIITVPARELVAAE